MWRGTRRGQSETCWCKSESGRDTTASDATWHGQRWRLWCAETSCTYESRERAGLVGRLCRFQMRFHKWNDSERAVDRMRASARYWARAQFTAASAGGSRCVSGK